MSQLVSITYKDPTGTDTYLTFLCLPIDEGYQHDEYFCKKICENHEWTYVGSRNEFTGTRKQTQEEQVARIRRMPLDFFLDHGIRGNSLAEAHAIQICRPRDSFPDPLPSRYTEVIHIPWHSLKDEEPVADSYFGDILVRDKNPNVRCSLVSVIYRPTRLLNTGKQIGARTSSGPTSRT